MGAATATFSSDLRIHNDRNAAHRLACSEVRGGNQRVDYLFELPGLLGWVYSHPLEPAMNGGDVQYLSVCDKGVLSRTLLADVAGHGEAVSAMAHRLRNLVLKNMNSWDQSMLMRELNEAFRTPADDAQYATAVVLGFYCRARELVFTNAGHPPPLWYHAQYGTWEWLEEASVYRRQVEGIPLGLISGTSYVQSAVQLGPGDLVILYTDGIPESRDEAGRELGQQGLLRMAYALPMSSPSAAGKALVQLLREFKGNSTDDDDQSLIVLQEFSPS
jgi:sigma-B regulation protein RsbU (phosphoserine phosphatase)